MYVTTQYIGGAGRTRYEFIDAVADLPANQDPQSHTLDWGEEPKAGETRHLIIGIAFITNSTVEPDTLTVGGDNASRIDGHAPAGIITVGQAFWIIEKPAGTSGIVEFGVPSGDIDGGMIAVWAAYNLKSTTAVATNKVVAFGAGTSDISVNVLAGGAAFAITSISNLNARSVNWSGLSEVAADETPTPQQWAASAFNLAAATPHSISVQRDDGQSLNALAVSFR